MKIEKTEHYTKINVGCGIIQITNYNSNPTSGFSALCQLTVSSDEDECGDYVDIDDVEIDAIIEALQNAKKNK